MSNFNIRGVPTYFVVDPEGNITFKQTGFPGVDTMKKEDVYKRQIIKRV